jgi:hypothetical protein
MKKLLFTILGMGILSLSAQLNQRFNFNLQGLQELKIVVKNGQSGNKRDIGTGWFDYVNAYNDFNGSGLENSAFVSWIQPDTNLNTVSSTGTKTKIGFHVLGRVNDPRDEVYSNNPVRFSRHNTYTWDSIRFTQFYIRNQDSMLVGGNMTAIVDTVFIQYFLPAGLETNGYAFQSDPNKSYFYTTPIRNNYKKATRLNSSAFKTDTIFLTEQWADSIFIDGADSKVFGRGVTINIGQTIPHSPTSLISNVVGHTIFFKPMKPTKLGDTGIAFNNDSVFNKHNMYGLRLFSKTDVKVENTDLQAQNNAVITNFEMVYGGTVGPSGLFKSYLPGTVFTNTIFDATEYHLTSNTVSIDNIDANGNGIGNIYPNPSNSAAEVFVPVKLSSAQAVTLTICDLTGKVVRTVSADYNAGDFDIAVSTLGLSKGMYTCTMVSNDYKGTTKFILN